MPFSAFHRQNLSLLRLYFIRGRQLTSVQIHLPYAKLQSVSSCLWLVWVAIEERSGANVSECMLYLAILSKYVVEGVDMRLDRLLQKWICARGFGRISEEVFALKGIVFGGPLGL